MGWLRRNRWGLVALVPVLAATVSLQWGDVYDRYWRNEPRQPVTASRDGWVAFAGARMRLTGLGPGTDLEAFGGEPYQPPDGTAVWRAKISFDAPNPDDLAGCEIAMADADGRTYEASPSELASTRAGFASCTPSSSDEGTAGRDAKAGGGTTKYEQTVYFLTPSATRPAGIRVTLRSEYPRYALLRL
jgi:hypothetical protein